MRCKQQAAATVKRTWESRDHDLCDDDRQGGTWVAAHTYANHVGCATAVWLNVIHEGVPYLHTDTYKWYNQKQEQPETCR